MHAISQTLTLEIISGKRFVSLRGPPCGWVPSKVRGGRGGHQRLRPPPRPRGRVPAGRARGAGRGGSGSGCACPTRACGHLPVPGRHLRPARGKLRPSFSEPFYQQTTTSSGVCCGFQKGKVLGYPLLLEAGAHAPVPSRALGKSHSSAQPRRTLHGRLSS